MGATAVGGREGRVTSDDGFIDLQLQLPTALGGKGGATNPEQLFAMGYSACFLGAMKFVAARDKLAIPNEPSIEGVVGIGAVPTGFAIEVERACATARCIATDVGAGEAKVFTHVLNKQSTWLNITFVSLTVNSDADLHGSPLRNSLVATPIMPQL